MTRASLGLLGLCLALLGSYGVLVLRAGQVSAVPPVAKPQSAGAALQAPLSAATETFLDQAIAVRFDDRSFESTWRALGLEIDPAALTLEADRLATAGQNASTLGPGFYAQAGLEEARPVALDRNKGLEVLVGYKDSYDRFPVDARVDLDHRQVIPEQDGYGIAVYDSLAVIEAAARQGETAVELAGGTIPPHVTQAQLGDLDVSHVMASFETKYPPGEKDRNYNLKLVAEHVNGQILLPGQLFSFNEVVGDRTEKEGYRVAHVITAGEMIDGLAGGACQISSTLHGAAWFSGLDIVKSTPHSRPSAYITMGLDATVVYPTADLKLSNPYDFPVAIHYVVSQGTVRVEILGRPRPYDKILYEREIKKEIPYQTITREDEELPIGSTLIEQIGFPGYELERRRVFLKDGHKVKTEKWLVKYPPTTEYLRMGTNPNPNLVPPVQPKMHGPMPPGEAVFTLAQ
jgi:vancomycin resistance protein YoaR